MDQIESTGAKPCEWPERERRSYKASLIAAKLWTDDIGESSVWATNNAICVHASQYKWKMDCSDKHGGIYHSKRGVNESFIMELNDITAAIQGLCLDCIRSGVNVKSSQCRVHL